MNLESDKRLNIQLRLDFSSAPTGEARQAGRKDNESLSVVSEPERPASTSRIMEEVCERGNLREALRQVRRNKGSAGVDRMTVDQLGDYLKQHWPAIRERLLNGTYEPKPVRRVEIPKPDGGGVRKLGIPAVLDRFIQQAVMQATNPGHHAKGQGRQHQDDNGGAGPVYAGLARLFRLLRNARGADRSHSLGPAAAAGRSLAPVENTTTSPSGTGRTANLGGAA